jgi:hypothetical protein
MARSLNATSGFRRDVDEKTSLFWGITQGRMVILYHSTLRHAPDKRSSQSLWKLNLRAYIQTWVPDTEQVVPPLAPLIAQRSILGNRRCCAIIVEHGCTYTNTVLLGAFATSQNAPIIFTFVCSSIFCMYLHDWTDFHVIWYWGLTRRTVDKIQIWLKSIKNIR